MRIWATLLLCVGLVAPAAAQETDRSFLQNTLERVLSDAGREVRIEGFEGALSSKARLSELTIADDDGVWLTLKDAQLDWSRSALLAGRLEIAGLTAKEILLPRLPALPESDADAQSTGFALPELPVSVQIGAIRADKIVLGAPVLGQAATMSLSGAAVLADGSGTAQLNIKRLDRAGQIVLAGGFDNATEELSLNLSVTEEEGGLLATMAQIPGAPALDLKLAGAGPLDDYRAELRLSSDAQTRLAGVIATKMLADTATRQYAASLSGDMAPLFAPDLQPFFGPEVSLAFLALHSPEGGVQVEQFALRAAQLVMAGTLELAPSGLPESLSFAASIAGDGPVVLPLTGPETRVDKAVIEASYDRARGDTWTLNAVLTGLERAQMALRQAQITGEGILTHEPKHATALINASLQGLDTGEPAIQGALTDRVDARLQLGWDGLPTLSVHELSVDSGGASVAVNGEIGFDPTVTLSGRGQLTLPDLARFSSLVGQRLDGAISAEIRKVDMDADGNVSLSFSAGSEDLSIGVDAVDRLLRGATDLHFDGGFADGQPVVTLLQVDNPQFSAQVVEESSGTLAITTRLTNLATLVPELPGSFSISGQVVPGSEQWQLDLNADGPLGLSFYTNGWVRSDGQDTGIDLRGSVPLGLANGFISPRTANGTAILDLRHDGRLGLAALSGTVSMSGARFADPSSYLVLENISGQVVLSSATAQLRIDATGEGGGTLAIRGPIGRAPPMSTDLSLALRGLAIEDPALFATAVDGDLTLQGPLKGRATISGRLTLAETELRVPSSVSGTLSAIPEITHISPPAAVQLTRSRAGLLAEDNGGAGEEIALNLQIVAPNRIFLRGQGVEAELGGQLRLAGTTADVVPSGRFDLLRGRVQILGQRLDLTEGFATMRGSLDPYVRLVAETRAEEIIARVTIEGLASDPELTFSSEPELPEDEVLARLLFGRSVQALSPFQAAQLAAAVTGLAGGSGSGIIGSLRETFALDDLDLTSDESGGTTVRAGKYLSDNLYTDITVGSTGQSEINLNLDLTPNITVRGGLDNEGETNLGVFFEKDY